MPDWPNRPNQSNSPVEKLFVVASLALHCKATVVASRKLPQATRFASPPAQATILAVVKGEATMIASMGHCLVAWVLMALRHQKGHTTLIA